MTSELSLRFPDKDHVIVRFGPDDDGSEALPFKTPITERDLRDIQWYVETYGAHSLGDPDDQEAHRIQKQLPIWGRLLFDAVFSEDEAKRRFHAFQEKDSDSRLITISADHPSILALPWELLHDSSALDGTFLFHEQPSISIRRRVADATSGRRPFKPVPKTSLHLLFVVSRPDDAGFLDPRADSLPVLDAIDQYAPGRVTCEFLRPATLDALNERLNDNTKPAVDILHFDGHGVFDRHGNLPNRVAAARTARIPRVEEILRDKQVGVSVDPDCPPNTGYLLFENLESRSHFVSAKTLGENLHRHKVALVILSACQSAAIGSEEKEQDDQIAHSMGSVASRLTATGIPSVLAMTHSVLVHSTRMLFGEFYKELARHRGIGEALDHARRFLARHPEKYEVQRGPDRVPLKLYDWFLPALYQQGADTALLKKERGKTQKEPTPARTNLSKAPEAGFFGRRRALWDIEQWFAGDARRITITGFGGQGKTALALEAGRWLTRTGLFQAAVFVDYSRVQTADAVAVARNEIGSVLGLTLIDAPAATVALRDTSTLVILDNLEALAPESLRALLDVAVSWSEAGGSRILYTTRRPDFEHPAYKIESTLVHRRIQLDGLGSKQMPDDALEWFAALMKLPPAPSVAAPKREALIELLERVKFHPLSVRVLAQQLKTRRIADVGERLEELLSAPKSSTLRNPSSEFDKETPAGLLASLELSLDKLNSAAREVLPRLGVFQGGALEEELTAVAGLGEEHQRAHLESYLAAITAGKAKEFFDRIGRPMPNESELRELVVTLRDKLAELRPSAPNVWAGLRRQLEAAALIEVEHVPGVRVPFLRFHPTLAPMLWSRLDDSERQRLAGIYRKRYYSLSKFLYFEDRRNPQAARAIAWRELPNLLHAVHSALDAGDPDAVDFADNVNRFVGIIFRMNAEANRLATRAQSAGGEVGSRAWYLAQANRGEQLRQAGQATEAIQVFQEILQVLGDTPTFERATIVGRLSRTWNASGRPDLAAQRASEALAVTASLTPDDEITRLRGTLLMDKGDALAAQGKYVDARQAYQDALAAKRETGGDLRGEGVARSQLGALEIREGNVEESLEQYRIALALFEQLREPAAEGTIRHQLGMALQLASQWDEAERHYRESARIKELIGDRQGAARTWNQLAIVSEQTGKPEMAEMWYRKAIQAFRATGDRLGQSRSLNNLADLLSSQPDRLAEARQLAEQTLEIDQGIDAGAAEIWKTYNVLASIAEAEAESTADATRKANLRREALEHKRLAREAERNFAGTRHQLRRFASTISATVMAVQDTRFRIQFEQRLPSLKERGWTNLVGAIRLILSGERDTNTLCANLDSEDSMIVEAIIAGIADPSTLSDLLPTEPPNPE